MYAVLSTAQDGGSLSLIRTGESKTDRREAGRGIDKANISSQLCYYVIGSVTGVRTGQTEQGGLIGRRTGQESVKFVQI